MRIRADPGSETDSEETRTGNFFYSFPRLIYCTVPDPGQKEPGSSFYTPRTPVCFPNFLPMHYEIDLVKIDVEEKKTRCRKNPMNYHWTPTDTVSSWR